MSMFGAPAPSRGDTGEVVATFTTYEAAQKAVSSLIAADVPARDIAIVGQGLRSIERVTGKLGYATAARTGAINGILLGLLFSVFFVVGQPDVPIQLFIGVMFVGVALGMLTSIATYSILRRRRDFASVMQVLADSYEVTVAPATSGKARQLLGARATAAPLRPVPAAVPAAGPVAPPLDAPPQYGERLPAPVPAPPLLPPRDARPGSDPSDVPASTPDEPQSPEPGLAGPGEPAPGPDVAPPGDAAPGPDAERPPVPPPGVAGAV